MKSSLPSVFYVEILVKVTLPYGPFSLLTGTTTALSVKVAASELGLNRIIVASLNTAPRVTEETTETSSLSSDNLNCTQAAGEKNNSSTQRDYLNATTAPQEKLEGTTHHE